MCPHNQSPVSNPSHGYTLAINGFPLKFSFWPTVINSSGWCANPTLFVSNPWTVMRDSIERRWPPLDASVSAQQRQASANDQQTSLAFLTQAEEFYRAASLGEIVAAKPLLIYYCFMNVAKAFILKSGVSNSDDDFHHGLTPFVDDDPNLAFVRERQPQGKSVFRKLATALFPNWSGLCCYQLSMLLAQMFAGHRLWCNANGNAERFVPLRTIQFVENNMPPGHLSGCLRIVLFRDEMEKAEMCLRGMPGSPELLPGVRLDRWCFTDPNPAPFRHPEWRPFVQIEQETYEMGASSAEIANKLARDIRVALWTAVLRVPPYRRYYLYLEPEQLKVLPQLLSMYVAFFYLGSAVRYHPNRFDKMLQGPFGAQIREIIATTPRQFLYLMASEFAEQEVAEPALV